MLFYFFLFCNLIRLELGFFAWSRSQTFKFDFHFLQPSRMNKSAETHKNKLI